MTAPELGTLLVRPATGDDLATIATLVPGLVVRPGQQLFVVADLAADAAQVLRAVAVVRPAVTRWFVASAFVDDGWPPVAAALVEQLRAAATATSATSLVFAATCHPEVLRAVVLDAHATVHPGGCAVLTL